MQNLERSTLELFRTMSLENQDEEARAFHNSRLRPWIYSQLRVKPIVFEKTEEKIKFKSPSAFKSESNKKLLLELDSYINNYLKQKNSSEQTTEEIRFSRRLKKALRPFHVNSSYWIGPYCIDLLIMNAQGKRDGKRSIEKNFRGIAIEIDGTIHDTEPKMKKDTSKEEYLKKFRIITERISNVDSNFNRALFQVLILMREQSVRVDWRSIQRLKLYCAIERVLSWSNSEQLEILFK